MGLFNFKKDTASQLKKKYGAAFKRRQNNNTYEDLIRSGNRSVKSVIDELAKSFDYAMALHKIELEESKIKTSEERTFYNDVAKPKCDKMVNNEELTKDEELTVYLCESGIAQASASRWSDTFMHLIIGALWVENARELYKKFKNADLDNEYFLNICKDVNNYSHYTFDRAVNEGVYYNHETHIIEKGYDKNYLIENWVTPEEIEHYFNIIQVICDEIRTGKDWDDFDCFDENGILLDKNGNYAEENVFENLPKYDFRDKYKHRDGHYPYNKYIYINMNF